MNKILKLGFILSVLSNDPLLAQSAQPNGRYKVIVPNDGSSFDLQADTLLCYELGSEEKALENGVYYFRFHGDTLDEIRHTWGTDPNDSTVIANEYWHSRLIRYSEMTSGENWYLVKGNPADSRFFQQSGDTLRLFKMSSGELPIGFRKGRATLVDTAGLRELLMVVGVLAAQSPHSTIQIYIHDPEASANRKQGVRLAKKRLAVLQKRLQSGLGDAYLLVRYVEKKSAVSNKGYSVTYRVE